MIRGAPRAAVFACPARVRLRAGVAVVAGRAVGGWRVRAEARRRIARARDMALIGGGADYGVRTGADARPARVGLRAGVAVIAGRAVGGWRVRAEARRRIARARDVALIG